MIGGEMKRLGFLTVVVAALLFSGCRIFFVSAPESSDPQERITITLELIGDPTLSAGGDTCTPVVCLGVPFSWSLAMVSYSGMADSVNPVSGNAAYDATNSSIMDAEHPISYSGEPGGWSCYLGPTVSWTPDAHGSVTLSADTGTAGAFTIYVSAGDVELNGPDLFTAEKRISLGGTLPDLEHWVRADLPADPDVTLHGVASGGGTHVAVGSEVWPLGLGVGGCIMHSGAGKRWSRVPGPLDSAVNAVHYADGRFVAVGLGGLVMTSTDGKSWQEKASGTLNALYDVTWADGTWTAVGYNSVLWTNDLNSWYRTSVPGVFRFNGIEHAAGLFVAVGYSNEVAAVIYTSPDLVDWTLAENSRSGQVYDVSYGNGRFVAVGDECLYYSDDGAEWNTVANPTDGGFRSVEWIDKTFIALGPRGAMYTSPDGAIWDPIASGTGMGLRDVDHDGTRYVVVGEGGLIMLSSNPSGGTGGGCSTSGFPPEGPAWPGMPGAALLVLVLMAMRKKWA